MDGGVEYGQLVVLEQRPSSEPLTYQWRTGRSIIEGALQDWLEKMEVSLEDGLSSDEIDPMLAALNHLAEDGWKLVAFEEVEPTKRTYYSEHKIDC